MARFRGAVGYVENTEVRPGIWLDEVTEKPHGFNVLQNTLQFQEDEQVNKDLALQDSVSFVADAYANEHFSAIRYVKRAGVFWVVTSVTLERPRLILRLGGVYNGKKPSPTP